MFAKRLELLLFWGLVVIFLTSNIREGQAVPSYARQTNLACNACHTIFPELRSFGRLFKLNGYTLTGIKAIESEGAKKQENLKLLSISPLSALVQTSFTHLDKGLPGTQNDDVGFPQHLSFFFAGEITPRIGTFIRVTYSDQGASFAWDNSDIRFANHMTVASKDLIYGVTLNNNPTVQDVWNSTPAWGFPYAFSSITPIPQASSLVAGGLAQRVLGLGGYFFYDGMLYGEFSLYRSAQQGGPHPPDASSFMTIKGLSPYWRIALQREWKTSFLEVGTYGLSSRLYPTGISGRTDRYTDIAVDMQYQYLPGNPDLTLHATWIHEKQDLDATFAAGGSTTMSNDLNTFRANGTLYFLERYALLLGYFNTSGDRNSGLYSPGSVNGSRTSKPNTNGVIMQVDYLPWFNTKFAIQYVVYNKFNGAGHDYDGFDRNASSNNTLYLLTWINF